MRRARPQLRGGLPPFPRQESTSSFAHMSGGMHAACYHLSSLVSSATAGPSGAGLGVPPAMSELPPLPTFTPTGGPSSGLDMLAAAALSQPTPQGVQTSDSAPVGAGTAYLHVPGPYNPAAALPPKVVKKILSLEFVEMSELRADVWPEDPVPSDTTTPPRRTARPPVIHIKIWLECYARMAAVLVSRFPEKGPELWAYKSTILNAAHSYEGSTWVAYDRMYRREMLACKDLNWSVPNSRLYNEAFTGPARMMPRCQHCLSEDHGSTGCPQHPNPVLVGWFQPPTPFSISNQQQGLASVTTPLPRTQMAEICRSFNAGQCRFAKCRYTHSCADCSGPHPALNCPRRLAPLANQGPTRPRSAKPRGTAPYSTLPAGRLPPADIGLA